MNISQPALWFTDLFIASKIRKGPRQNLALARALVLVLLSIIFINLSALWVLLPPGYVFLPIDWYMTALSTGSMLILLMALRIFGGVATVGMFMCLSAILTNLVYILFDESGLSTQYIWMISMPIMALVFVGIRFGSIIALLSIYVQYAARSYNSDLPAIYGHDIVAYTNNYNISLIANTILLFIISAGFYYVVHYMLNIIKSKSEELETANEALRELSYLDKLTGLFNRHYFDDSFPEIWNDNLKAGTSFTVLLLDVDFFKPYNDNYGHVQGDECLQSVASVLKGSIHRSNDFVFRWGGEEFLILLNDADEHAAEAVASHIRSNLKEREIIHEHSSVSEHLTISIGGVCIIPTTETAPEDLIELADQGLYHAKENGRDRAVIQNWKALTKLT